MMKITNSYTYLNDHSRERDENYSSIDADTGPSSASVSILLSSVPSAPGMTGAVTVKGVALSLPKVSAAALKDKQAMTQPNEI
jgi:hypothetical protein